MNRLINILEEKLVPVAAWIEQNKYINGIRRAFIMLMPPEIAFQPREYRENDAVVSVFIANVIIGIRLIVHLAC